MMIKLLSPLLLCFAGVSAEEKHSNLRVSNTNAAARKILTIAFVNSPTETRNATSPTGTTPFTQFQSTLSTQFRSIQFRSTQLQSTGLLNQHLCLQRK